MIFEPGEWFRRGLSRVWNITRVGSRFSPSNMFQKQRTLFKSWTVSDTLLRKTLQLSAKFTPSSIWSHSQHLMRTSALAHVFLIGTPTTGWIQQHCGKPIKYPTVLTPLLPLAQWLSSPIVFNLHSWKFPRVWHYLEPQSAVDFSVWWRCFIHPGQHRQYRSPAWLLNTWSVARVTEEHNF